jgi:hypothetical protein
MLLNEFFGSAIALGKKEDHKNPDNKNNTDQVFWYILDHNKLHKDHFHPLASKIKKHHTEDKLDRESMMKEFMPMVKKGCKEFYHQNKLPGHFENNFDSFQKVLNLIIDYQSHSLSDNENDWNSEVDVQQ